MPKDAESDVCSRCAEHSGTCCTLTYGQEELCFPLSSQERAAMVAAGAQERHFAKQENTEAFVENLCRLFPGEAQRIQALFPLGGSHERLALAENGSCLLLGPEGCKLPRQARPWYCRLFPFWIRSGRRLYFEFPQCQAQLEAKGGGNLMARLGMTAEGVRSTYTTLRQAWGLPERP